MTDILIRDVPESTVVEIDRRARAAGMSRNEYLRRQLDQQNKSGGSASMADLERLSHLARDLDDPEVMRGAWS